MSGYLSACISIGYCHSASPLLASPDDIGEAMLRRCIREKLRQRRCILKPLGGRVGGCYTSPLVPSAMELIKICPPPVFEIVESGVTIFVNLDIGTCGGITLFVPSLCSDNPHRNLENKSILPRRFTNRLRCRMALSSVTSRHCISICSGLVCCMLRRASSRLPAIPMRQPCRTSKRATDRCPRWLL